LLYEICHAIPDFRQGPDIFVNFKFLHIAPH